MTVKLNYLKKKNVQIAIKSKRQRERERELVSERAERHRYLLNVGFIMHT